MAQRLYVCLGRLGDIINFLPVCLDESKNGTRCSLMVAKQYADVLEGCSYVDPVIFDGEPWQIDRAMETAKTLSADVVFVQVAGPIEPIQKYGYKEVAAESFQKESWLLAKKLSLWQEQPPLLFDRRNPEREAKLKEWLVDTYHSNRFILVACGGKSSPFPAKETLMELLHSKFNKKSKPVFAVVDLDDVKAERFYDILGLFESANCLIAGDSAPLHLAYACKTLPVIALINDYPTLWNGSVWRPNHICHIRYGDFGARLFDVVRAIEGIDDVGSWFSPTLTAKQRLIHVWNQAELSASNRDRHNAAKATWKLCYESNNWVSCPIERGATGRNSDSVWEDRRSFPSLKDAIRLATLRAKPDDVIVLTRSDTQLSMILTGVLPMNLPCYARRWLTNPDQYHPAADLFAFKVSWWNKNKNDCPDMVMGMDIYWPRVLMEFLRGKAATEFNGRMISRPHSGPASRADNDGAQRVAFNQGIAQAFLKDIKPSVPPVDQQLPALPVNRAALSPFGYNPSIIRFKSRLFMAYRWHFQGSQSSTLSMAELTENGEVTSNVPISIPLSKDHSSAEDPRLFIFNEQLWISCVVADLTTFKSIVRYGRLEQKGSTWNIAQDYQLDYPGNDGTSIQKNWVFFEQYGHLYTIYESTPRQTILEVSGTLVHGEHKSDSPAWPWGVPKGGSTPLPYLGKLLRFFHSSLDNEQPPHRRRYYCGALLMEPEPPFKVVQISKSPILRGSESDELAVNQTGTFHSKPQVVFPAGAAQTMDGWLLSVGINDNTCAILRIKPENLNL